MGASVTRFSNLSPSHVSLTHHVSVAQVAALTSRYQDASPEKPRLCLRCEKRVGTGAPKVQAGKNTSYYITFEFASCTTLTIWRICWRWTRPYAPHKQFPKPWHLKVPPPCTSNFYQHAVYYIIVCIHAPTGSQVAPCSGLFVGASRSIRAWDWAPELHG